RRPIKTWGSCGRGHQQNVSLWDWFTPNRAAALSTSSWMGPTPQFGVEWGFLDYNPNSTKTGVTVWTTTAPPFSDVGANIPKSPRCDPALIAGHQRGNDELFARPAARYDGQRTDTPAGGP